MQQTPDGDISAAHATARALVITAREDLQIAHEVRLLLRTHTHSDHPKGQLLR